MTIERPTGLSAGFHAHLRQAGVPGLAHAGDQHAPTSWVIGSHTHDVWELYLQLTGPPTRWTVADHTWHVPARGLLMVPPDVPHAMAESSTAPYHFHFAALAPADIVPPDDLHPLWGQRRPFVITDAGSMVAPFALFLREVATHQPLRTVGLACAAALLVIEASRLADSRPPVRHLAMHPAIATANRRIENHLADGLTVDDLAVAAHLSPAHFAELFRTEIGETPARYRTRLRMERARLLLAETDLPITVIAMDLGYSSSQHFATAFRRETDTTPSRYRCAVRSHGPSGPAGFVLADQA
ncbi:helix-turn-helix domain-containing protein [Streptomyces sp. NPDC001933]|uniref:helix-turn-helix domain-containing protein n=1 Tax=Streptomyces sp. NPDC001933 TaxID=3364626 RepID=UPI00367B3A87